MLESFQTSSGADQGAFNFPGVSGPNIIATYQAVPAVAGVIFPFNLFVTTSSLPAGTVTSLTRSSSRRAEETAPYTWSLVKGHGTLPSGLTLTAQRQDHGYADDLGYLELRRRGHRHQDHFASTTSQCRLGVPLDHYVNVVS